VTVAAYRFPAVSQSEAAEPATPWRQERSLRIWGVIAALAVLAAGLVVTAFLHPVQPPHDRRISWVVLALLFALTEAVVLHVQIRREARSVSLSEVPLCLGLFFADPAALLVARLVGSSVIWLFWRRQAVIKTAFNLVNATVEIAVALLVFAAVSASAGVDNPRTWVAAALAAIVSNVVTAIAVSGVIGAAENNNPFPEMLAGVASSTPFAAFVSAYGLLAAAALSFRWWMAIPLGAAAVGSILVYWAYASLAGRHLSLERLYRFSQVVGSTPEVDEVLRTVLVEAKGLLRADRAEILFVTPASGQPGLTVRLGPNGRLMRGSAGDELHLDPVWHSVLDLSMPALLQRHTRDRIERGHLELRGLQDAIVAPVTSAWSVRSRSRTGSATSGPSTGTTCGCWRRSPTPRRWPGRTAGSSTGSGTTRCTTP
jgi:hypothetical protein